MSGEEELQNALLGIYSRLGTIEGKINLVARAEREQLIGVIADAIKDDPLIGQAYLLLDGVKKQKDIRDELANLGVDTSQPTLSRRMGAMVTEYGIADPVGSGGILRKNAAAEDVLNLSRRIKSWLQQGGHIVPEQPRRRQRKSKS